MFMSKNTLKEKQKYFQMYTLQSVDSSSYYNADFLF